MNCQEFREKVSEMLFEGGDPLSSAKVAAHREACPECAVYLKEMVRTFTVLQPAGQITASSGFKEKVMSKIEQMDSQTPSRPEPRRFRPRTLKVAAAAACLLGLFLITPLHKLFRIDSVAYAIEQTIEANLGLRSIHIKSEPVPSGSVSDIWAEFDGKGAVSRLRMSFPQTDDGPKEVLWQKDVAEVYFKKKNLDLLTSAPELLAHLKMSLEGMDPRRMTENLQKQAAAGAIDMKTQEPATAGGPITLSVISKKEPDLEHVFQVDPQSKLVLRRDRYQTKDGQKVCLGSMIFLDYNAVDPSVFKLDVPQNATRIDQTVGGVGLAKGTLSDREIAAKVARSFFESLMVEDYDRAGRLMEGLPGPIVRQWMTRKGVKVVRVESIGEPRPHSKPQTRGLEVPCKIEIEREGKKSIEEFNLGVRPVENEPERWDVFGGF